MPWIKATKNVYVQFVQLKFLVPPYEKFEICNIFLGLHLHFWEIGLGEKSPIGSTVK